jgi:membrane protein
MANMKAYAANSTQSAPGQTSRSVTNQKNDSDVNDLTARGQPAPEPQIWKRNAVRFNVIEMGKRTYQKWQADRVPTQAAALAYYTVFALAPLLLVVLAVAGLFAPADAARARLISEVAGLVGQDGANWINDLLTRASSSPRSGIVSVVLGLGGLFLGASGAFGQLQLALNTIWDAKPPANITAFVRARAASFGLVLVMGFLLLVSLSVSAALTALGDRLGLDQGAWLWRALYEVISALTVSFLFAVIYKFLPDSPVAWRPALIGGLFTSVLFAVGKALIGIYLGVSASSSIFGAAGTLAILLLWIYYAAQLFLFGAEFTQVYAEMYGPAPASTAENQTPLEEKPETKLFEDREISLERRVLESGPLVQMMAGGLTLGALWIAWQSQRKPGRRPAEQIRRAEGLKLLKTLASRWLP